MKNSVNPTVVDASDKVSTGEIIAYGMGGVASTMPSEFKKSFSMPFLTDVVGLPIQLMGTITMLMTIWDAINDPIIGGIADRTNSRWGKYRSHMYIGGFLSAVVTILLFVNPNWGSTGNLIYATVLLLLWSVFFTQFGVPWQALNSVMSTDPNQRNLLLTSRQMAGFFAGAAVGIMTLPIVNALGGGNMGWLAAAGVVGIITTITAILSANGAKRKDYPGSIPTPPPMHLTQQLDIIIKNPAVIFSSLAFGMVSLIQALGAAINLYYLRIVVQNTGILSITSALGLISSIVFIPMIPKLIRVFGKIPLVVIGLAIYMINPMVLFFLRENATPLQVIVLALISNLGFAICNVVILSFIPDCIDYTEYKFGTAQAGLINASVTFMRKFCAAFATFIVGTLLAMVNYDPDIITPEVVDMILNIRIYIPLILAAFCLLFLRLYPITAKFGQEMRAELKARRAAANS